MADIVSEILPTAAMPVVGVLEIEDGRVQMWPEYYDRAILRRSLGLE